MRELGFQRSADGVPESQKGPGVDLGNYSYKGSRRLFRPKTYPDNSGLRTESPSAAAIVQRF